jgi:hypothetical protein
MSTSADALLIYGYIWPDEYNLFGDDVHNDAWETRLAVATGSVDPWATRLKEIDQLPCGQRHTQGMAWHSEHRAELDAWYEAKVAAVVSYGISVDYHGSNAWRCPVVKITDGSKTAACGCPEQVIAADLTIGADWNIKLDRFITDLGIDVSKAAGPGWFLASYLG